MTDTTPTPRRIEWTGPEGCTVWADEDGCHIRFPNGGGALEQPDVARLFALWEAARRQFHAGSIPAPRPPSDEEVRTLNYHRAAEHAKRRAVRAIEAEFDPDSSVTPF
jgi:hypothetical protein